MPRQSPPHRAGFCCICEFPLPSFCRACGTNHEKKPGSHYFLPLAVRQEIKTERELIKVQTAYSKLPIKEKELRSVLNSFRRAREEIEAKFEEAVKTLTEMKNAHLGKLQECVDRYQRLIDEAMRENYANGWKGKALEHSDPSINFILKREPGEDPNLDLLYAVEFSKQHLESLFIVKWALPFPGFPGYPEGSYPFKVGTYPLKVILDSNETHTVLMQPSQTLAGVREELSLKGISVSPALHFANEFKDYQDERKLNPSVINKTIFLTSKATVQVHYPIFPVLQAMRVDLNWKVKDFIAQQSITSTENVCLVYEDQCLVGECTLASYGIESGADLKFVFAYVKPFTFFVNSSGKILTINAPNSVMTIAEVKRKIEEMEGLAANLHLLTTNGRKLATYRTLLDYDIGPESMLQIEPKKRVTVRVSVNVSCSRSPAQHLTNVMETVGSVDDMIQLNLQGTILEDDTLAWPVKAERDSVKVTVMNGYNITVITCIDKILTFEVNDTHTVGAVKTLIQDAEGIPIIQQWLIYKGRHLQDEQLLANYQICEKSTLILALRQPSPIPIFVKTFSGKIITVDTKDSDTIDGIKAILQDKIGIPPDEQRLFFGAKELTANTHTLASLGIKKESILALKASRQITVKLQSGKSVLLDVTTCITIRDVKVLAQRKTSIPVDIQTFTYESRLLEDDQTLAHYKVPSPATFDLSLRLHGNMYLLVQTPKGSMVFLDVDSSDTVKTLKGTIQEKTGISADTQILIWENQRLEDVRTLEQCGVRSESVLKLEQYQLIPSFPGAIRPPPSKNRSKDT